MNRRFNYDSQKHGSVRVLTRLKKKTLKNLSEPRSKSVFDSGRESRLAICKNLVLKNVESTGTERRNLDSRGREEKKRMKIQRRLEKKKKLAGAADASSSFLLCFFYSFGGRGERRERKGRGSQHQGTQLLAFNMSIRTTRGTQLVATQLLVFPFYQGKGSRYN